MLRSVFALALVAGLSTHALAASDGTEPDPVCGTQFLNGKRPALTSPQPGELELCKSAYSVLWSPETREPVYAAEHLTKDSLEKAKHVERTGSFHVEPEVPRGLRVTNDDYGDGYDKGHMAAEHDMPDAAAAHESFSYANAVPQDPTNNRGPWAHIEEQVRVTVLDALAGEGWIVTGPVFDAQPKVTGETHIPVPTHLFKAIYVPASANAQPIIGAWIARNAADPSTRFVSLNALKAEAGVDPFPSLSAELHATAALPPPARKQTGIPMEPH